MQMLRAWKRPRHYYLYPEKTDHQPWIYAATMAAMLAIIVPVCFLTLKHRAAPSYQKSLPVYEAADVAQTPLPVTDNEPADPLTVHYEGVAQSVQAWVNKQQKSQWGVVVQDLDNPANRVSVNASTSFRSASLYKLFLTIALAQKLPFSSWQNQHTLNGQGDRTIADCVQAMLAKSDNPCGEAIGSYVDWAKATKVVRAEGFKSTSLDAPQLSTTADDTANYLAGLDQGEWFNPSERAFILDSLAHQKFRTGIPTGCLGCTVLNKTGDLPGVANDAAIVTHGNSRYVVVILSKNGSFAQIADLSKLIAAQLQ